MTWPSAEGAVGFKDKGGEAGSTTEDGSRARRQPASRFNAPVPLLLGCHTHATHTKPLTDDTDSQAATHAHPPTREPCAMRTRPLQRRKNETSRGTEMTPSSPLAAQCVLHYQAPRTRSRSLAGSGSKCQYRTIAWTLHTALDLSMLPIANL